MFLVREAASENVMRIDVISEDKLISRPCDMGTLKTHRYSTKQVHVLAMLIKCEI